MKRSLTLTRIYLLVEPLGRNFNLGALIGICGLVILSLSCLFSVWLLGQKTQLLNSKQTTLITWERIKPNPPTAQRLEFFKNEKERFDQLAPRLEASDIFWTRFDYTDAQRLEFKEFLFALKEELARTAAARNVVIEKEAQPPSFENSLPAEDRLPELFMEVKLTEEIEKTLIQSGVARIEKLNFPEARRSEIGQGLERFNFPFELKIDTSWEALLLFLRDLARSNHLWQIDRINLQHRNPKDGKEIILQDAPLEADLVVSGTFFAQRKNQK